jgi:hypothetical protein
MKSRANWWGSNNGASGRFREARPRTLQMMVVPILMMVNRESRYAKPNLWDSGEYIHLAKG